jgi:hypothetical protein
MLRSNFEIALEYALKFLPHSLVAVSRPLIHPISSNLKVCHWLRIQSVKADTKPGPSEIDPQSNRFTLVSRPSDDRLPEGG